MEPVQSNTYLLLRKRCVCHSAPSQRRGLPWKHGIQHTCFWDGWRGTQDLVRISWMCGEKTEDRTVQHKRDTDIWLISSIMCYVVEPCWARDSSAVSCLIWWDLPFTRQWAKRQMKWPISVSWQSISKGNQKWHENPLKGVAISKWCCHDCWNHRWSTQPDFPPGEAVTTVITVAM